MALKFKQKRMLIIVFFSLVLVSWLYNRVQWMGIYVYDYETASGRFHDIEIPAKGLEMKTVLSNFEEYKDTTSISTDTILYRTFKINFWQVVAFPSTLKQPRYELPYKELTQTR
jgi:hypothetical protein